MSHRKLSASRSSARKIAVSTIAATLLSATGFCVNPAVAQPKTAAAKPGAATARPGYPAPAAGQPQLPKLVYSTWAKFCGKGQDPHSKQVCITGRDGRTESGVPVVGAALIEPQGESRKLFRVTLPSPLQLQFGTRLIIDKDQPISGAFFTCYANRCMADYNATPEFIAKLKKGQMLQIQAINLAENAITFPVPLADKSGDSFAKANDGPPVDPKVFEAQQKKLQEDLQKRAEELRKKLEAQQSARKP